MTTNKFSLKKNILTELLSFFFNIALPAFVWSATLFLGIFIYQEGHYWGFLLLPLFSAVFYIFLVLLLRLALPKLKAGAYDLKKDPMVIYWYLHMSLNRSVKSVGLQPIIRSSNLLKYLHFKALGAKIAYSTNFSIDLELVDPSLITIEENVIIGGRCYMGCHVVFNNKLILGNIEIKKNSFISLENVIGQGTVVEENVVVGTCNYLYRDHISKGTKIPNFGWSEGSPKNRKNSPN